MGSRGNSSFRLKRRISAYGEEIGLAVCEREIRRLVDLLKEFSKVNSEYEMADHRCFRHDVMEDCEALSGYREELRIINNSINEAIEALSACLERR